MPARRDSDAADDRWIRYREYLAAHPASEEQIARMAAVLYEIRSRRKYARDQQEGTP